MYGLLLEDAGYLGSIFTDLIDNINIGNGKFTNKMWIVALILVYFRISL